MFNEKNNAMKKYTVPRLLLVVFIMLTGLSLFSCNSDSPEIPPVKLEDIKGNYKARLITIQGNFRTEKIIGFTVKKDTIAFEDFPVSEIVKSVIKDPAKAEAAIKAMGKVKYDLQYNATVNAGNNVLELTFTPKIMELQIPVDGTNKKAMVLLNAKQKGFYVGMDQSLRFAFSADKITVDGLEISPYDAINYNLPFCIKN